jgi:hypothetical protein
MRPSSLASKSAGRSRLADGSGGTCAASSAACASGRPSCRSVVAEAASLSWTSASPRSCPRSFKMRGAACTLSAAFPSCSLAAAHVSMHAEHASDAARALRWRGERRKATNGLLKRHLAYGSKPVAGCRATHLYRKQACCRLQSEHLPE